jgi:hypothetical protein
MGKPAKVTVLMVRDPNTQLHRFGGVFTQKQHLWAALESLGVAEDSMLRTGMEDTDDELKPANYRNLCAVLRTFEAGSMIVICAPHDDKLAVFSEVEMNQVYEPGGPGNDEEDDEQSD